MTSSEAREEEGVGQCLVLVGDWVGRIVVDGGAWEVFGGEWAGELEWRLGGFFQLQGVGNDSISLRLSRVSKF
jgi:hypothetical protein